MKQLPLYGLISLVLLGLLVYTYPPINRLMAQERTPPKPFPTIEAAVQKAQADLVEVLTTVPDVNLGLKPEPVKAARPGKPIPILMVDFEQLLDADTSTLLQDIARSEDQVIVPLRQREQPVTVIRLAQVESGWDIAGLGDGSLTRDLTELPAKLLQNQPLRLYHIPNLTMVVFAAETRQGPVYFSRLGGEQSLRKLLSPADLMAQLVPAARRFEREFGDLLRKDARGLVD